MLPRRAMLRAAPTLVVFGITAAASAALAQPAPPPAEPPVEGEPAPPPAVDAAAVEALRARIEALEAAAQDAPPATAPAAAPTPAPVAAEEAELRVPAVEDDGAHRGGFRFGSYGRVVAGTDLRGGKPAPVHVAAHGPRVVEQSYLELDLTLGAPIRYGAGFLLGSHVTSPFGLGTPKAFGHLGFTNVFVWADPERDLAAALLTTGKPALSPGLAKLFWLLTTIARHIPKVARTPRH